MSVRFSRRGLLLALLAVGSSPSLGGPLLPPPGPIASTMKTLAEVEPRTAINAVNTPGNNVAVFRITQPGSYYLTGDVSVSGNQPGILISASNVTIDLNGFTISGSGGSNLLQQGITTSGSVVRVKVRNGTIVGLGADGILLDSGAAVPQHHVVEDVTVRACAGSGIRIAGGVVRNARISGCVKHGIHAVGNHEVLIEQCLISDIGEEGIRASRATVVNSTISRCGVSGIQITRGAVRACTLIENGRGVSIDPNGPAFGVLVEDSLFVDNLNGVMGGGWNNMIRRNVIRADETRRNWGIYLTGAGHVVEENMVTFMTDGIQVTGSANLIRANTIITCIRAFNLAAGNRVGTIVNPTSSPAIVGSSGGGLGTTDPHANFAY